jgi:hypothetical protein
VLCAGIEQSMRELVVAAAEREERTEAPSPPARNRARRRTPSGHRLELAAGGRSTERD